MTLKTQTFFIFSFASLAPVASLALNPVWLWLRQVITYAVQIYLTTDYTDFTNFYANFCVIRVIRG